MSFAMVESLEGQDQGIRGNKAKFGAWGALIFKGWQMGVG